MDAKDFINKYHITTVFVDGELKIQLHPTTKPTEAEIKEIIANKPAILAEFKARWEKEAEDARHTHKVVIFGWEATTIYVDDREDIEKIIDTQFEYHGEYLGCSREDIARQITKALKINAKNDTPKEDVVEDNTTTKFSIIETHEVTQANGGEMGVDGRADVTLRRNPDGEMVRVIELNVFDVGHYGIPHDKRGTDAALDRNTWTDLETQAVDWICKYGPLTCKHMRM